MKKQIFAIVMMILSIITFNSCEKESLEMENETTSLESKERATRPKHQQVIDNIAPEREPLSEEEYQKIIGQLKGKSNGFNEASHR